MTNHLTIGKHTSQEQFLVSISWDYQNIPNAKLAQNLLLFATSLGYVVNRKVYDNWEMKNKTITEIFGKLGFECINVSQRIKNAVDFYLFGDCCAEAASSVYPHIFIIVSGDCYCELLIDKLQAKGKKVIVFARKGNERKTLENKADKFYFLEDLPKLAIAYGVS